MQTPNLLRSTLTYSDIHMSEYVSLGCSTVWDHAARTRASATIPAERAVSMFLMPYVNVLPPFQPTVWESLSLRLWRWSRLHARCRSVRWLRFHALLPAIRVDITKGKPTRIGTTAANTGREPPDSPACDHTASNLGRRYRKTLEGVACQGLNCAPCGIRTHNPRIKRIGFRSFDRGFLML